MASSTAWPIGLRAECSFGWDCSTLADGLAALLIGDGRGISVQGDPMANVLHPQNLSKAF